MNRPWKVIEDKATNVTWYIHPDIKEGDLFGVSPHCDNYDRLCYVIQRDDGRKKLLEIFASISQLGRQPAF